MGLAACDWPLLGGGGGQGAAYLRASDYVLLATRREERRSVYIVSNKEAAPPPPPTRGHWPPPSARGINQRRGGARRTVEISSGAQPTWAAEQAAPGPLFGVSLLVRELLDKSARRGALICATKNMLMR